MFSAFVITVSERRRSRPIRLAIRAVVVPESRMIVSPSRISRGRGLRDAHLLAAVEGLLEHEGDVLDHLPAQRAAVRADDAAGPRERVEVAADGHGRDPEVAGQLLDRGPLALLDELADAGPALLQEERPSAGAGRRRASPGPRGRVSFDFVRLCMLSSYSRLRSRSLSRKRGGSGGFLNDAHHDGRRGLADQAEREAADDSRKLARPARGSRRIRSAPRGSPRRAAASAGTATRCARSASSR